LRCFSVFRGFSPRDLAKRSFIIPYLLVTFAYFTGHWGGMTPLQTFAVPIFNQLGSPINSYTATILIGKSCATALKDSDFEDGIGFISWNDRVVVG